MADRTCNVLYWPLLHSQKNLVLYAQGVSVQGVYVLGGKCPGGKYPGGICPRGYVS